MIWLITTIALQASLNETERIYSFEKKGEPYIVATVIETSTDIKAFIKNKHPGKIVSVYLPILDYGAGVDEFENKLGASSFNSDYRQISLRAVTKLKPGEESKPILIEFKEYAEPIVETSQKGIYLFSIDFFQGEHIFFYEIRLLKNKSKEYYSVYPRLHKKLTEKELRFGKRYVSPKAKYEVITNRIKDWLENNKFKYTPTE